MEEEYTIQNNNFDLDEEWEKLIDISEKLYNKFFKNNTDFCVSYHDFMCYMKCNSPAFKNIMLDFDNTN